MHEEHFLIDPSIVNSDLEDPVSQCWATPERKKYMSENKPYQLEIELTSKCKASCSYCYASAHDSGEYTLTTEQVVSLLDEAVELEVKLIGWDGGDPLLHPDWFNLASYAAEKGLGNMILTSGLVSKEQANKLAQVKNLEVACIHIDSIVPEAYNQVHNDPKTLELRIKGYRNMLEAGIPPEKIMPIMTLTKPVVETIEKTIDWYVDEMGAKFICMLPYKREGFGKGHENWEVSLSEVRRAIEYRAKRLGDHWLRIGTSDGSKYYCRTLLCVFYDGQVAPCTVARAMAVGNIKEKSLKDIFHEHRDWLLFNLEVQGPCATCQNSDVCFGCRVTAYHYLGDATASDPKCFMNTEAKEYYYQ